MQEYDNAETSKGCVRAVYFPVMDVILHQASDLKQFDSDSPLQ